MKDKIAKHKIGKAVDFDIDLKIKKQKKWVYKEQVSLNDVEVKIELLADELFTKLRKKYKNDVSVEFVLQMALNSLLIEWINISNER